MPELAAGFRTVALGAGRPAAGRRSGPVRPVVADPPVRLTASGPADQPAVTGAGRTLTHGELRALAAAEAGRYRPGERVPVCDPDPVRVLGTVLAAHRAGATPVVVDPAWPTGQIREGLRLARAGEVVLSDGEPLGWIGFTSGSAGTPRPIGRTASSWADSFPLVSGWTGIGTGRRVLVPGSLASSLFLFGALHALSAGAHVLAPGRWEPERLPTVDAVHCVPAMLADLAGRADLAGTGAVPAVAVCGGAAIPDRVRRAARDRGITVLDYYGATELSFVAWRSADGRLLPFPGVEIEVRDGEIWARGRYLSRGYVAEVGGPLRFDDAGFASVGDLGALNPDGSLAIHGRGDGTILTGGAPVLPEDVEAVLRAVDGVRDVVVFGTPHERLGAVVTAVVEPARDGGAGLAALRRAAGARLAGPQRPRLWYAVDRMPRTGSGKPARQAIVDGLSDGTLPVSRLR